MTTAVRLPEDLKHRLNHLARETHRSKTFYIRQALEEYLEDREDYLLALAVKERVRQGTEKTYSLSEAKKLLGLADD